jgi:hypothetical protein
MRVDYPFEDFLEREHRVFVDTPVVSFDWRQEVQLGPILSNAPIFLGGKPLTATMITFRRRGPAFL